VLSPLGSVRVDGPSGHAETLTNGVYSLTASGWIRVSAALGVTTSQAGSLCFVADFNGGTTGTGVALNGSAIVFGPGSYNFVLGPGGTIDSGVAQANAFVVLNEVRSLFRAYLASDPAWLSTPVKVKVNLGGSPSNVGMYHQETDTIDMRRLLVAGDPEDPLNYWNTCYEGILPHEYGHRLVVSLGLSNGTAFGEGFGDTLVILLTDAPVVGRAYLTYGGIDSNVREDPTIANCQYPISSTDPCGGDIHPAGQLLSDIWWRIRNNLVSSLGGDVGVGVARGLFVSWMNITEGGENTLNAAFAGTAIEVLTVDDDDDTLSNGTPHDSEICAAFASHSISCP
jgi:hypothetical protein